MIFCGQCGLQLAPGTTRCPRCGTEVEEPTMPVEDLASPDAPTTASPSLLGRSPVPPTIRPTPQPAPGPPTRGGAPNPSGNPSQKLVLPPAPGEDYNYNTQAAYEGTSRVNTPSYDQQQMSTLYPTQEAYGGYRTQSGGNYPPQQVYGGYQPSGAYEQQPSSNSRGRLVGLVLILLGLLLILGAIALFALQRNNVIGSGGGGANNTVSTTSGGGAGDSRQAQAVIQQYYDAINKKDYQTAYGLWKDNKQSFAAFKNGYRNTQEDRLRIGGTTAQQDGSVKVGVTVNATERAQAGLKQSIYTGYYIVGKQSDGTWKIIDGNLQLAQP